MAYNNPDRRGGWDPRQEGPGGGGAGPPGMFGRQEFSGPPDFPGGPGFMPMQGRGMGRGGPGGPGGRGGPGMFRQEPFGGGRPDFDNNFGGGFGRGDGFGRGGDDWFGGRGGGPPGGRMNDPYNDRERYGRFMGDFPREEGFDGGFNRMQQPGMGMQGPGYMGPNYNGNFPPGGPGGFPGPGGGAQGFPPYGGRQQNDFRPPYEPGRPPFQSPGHGPFQSPGHVPGAGPVNTLVDDLSALTMGSSTAAGNLFAHQSVSLEMSAKGLKKKDIIGKSDPVCYVYIPEERSLHDGRASSPSSIKWKVLSRTEVIKNTHSPTWSTRVTISFNFEEYQPLRFSIYDADGISDSPRDGDKIGECCVSLGDIVRRGLVNVELVRSLRSGSASSRYGQLTIRSHTDSVEGKLRLKTCFGARDLTKSDIVGKSDPFYVFTLLGSTGEESRQIHKSEVIRETLSPDWRPRRDLIPTHGRPWDRIKLRVTIYDHDNTSRNDLLGTVDFTLQQLCKYNCFDIINEKKASEERSKYKNSGKLLVHQAIATRMPSFLSYLQGGLELHFLVCVDFSHSDRGNLSSLHRMHDGRPSLYAQALGGIGTILHGYLHNGMIAALGFGAKPRYANRQMDKYEPFPLNENPNDPRVRGVEGLLNCYNQAVNNVREGGRTKFEPIVRHAMRITEHRPLTQSQQNFTILVVLTDGQVDDMDDTVDAIIDCSYRHPIAIVFVGIGKGDMTDLRRLDGDRETLRSKKTGKRAKHDIVQFTHFKPHENIENLAGSVLKEIPRRLVTYMMDANISPNAPMHTNGHPRSPMLRPGVPNQQAPPFPGGPHGSPGLGPGMPPPMVPPFGPQMPMAGGGMGHPMGGPGMAHPRMSPQRHLGTGPPPPPHMQMGGPMMQDMHPAMMPPRGNMGNMGPPGGMGPGGMGMGPGMGEQGGRPGMGGLGRGGMPRGPGMRGDQGGQPRSF